jgi:carboxylesterase type B
MAYALTGLGNIKGRRVNKPSVHFAFYKVPFAKPPVGSRRFALPELVEPWKGNLGTIQMRVLKKWG